MLAGANGTTGPQLTPGDMINGSYRVLQVLGEGGMGVVYEAEKVKSAGIDETGEPVYESTGEFRAIKTPHASLALLGEIKGRFKREAMIGALLNHRNIAHISDCGEFYMPKDDGETWTIPFLAMEMLRGRDLSSFLRSRPNQAMTFEEAYPILIQVMDGLEAAHKKHIVHRDLKPENIFLCEGDEGEPPCVKLMDFGIAKLLDQSDVTDDLDKTRIDICLGTPSYMAPEQALQRNDKVDQLTDIWALGAIIYRMIAGRKPFIIEKKGDRLKQVAAHAVPTPLSQLVEGVPVDLQAVVGRAMSPWHLDRFGSIAEFRAALQRIPRDESAESQARTILATQLKGAQAAFIGGKATATPTTARAITMTPRRRRGKFRYLLAFLALAGAGTYLGYRFDIPPGCRGQVESVIEGGKKLYKKGEELIDEHF